MTAFLLMDPEAAGELVNQLVGSADALDVNRGGLRIDLDDAADLLDLGPCPHDLRLRAIGVENRSDARDLAVRIRCVVFGGERVNGGLRALAEVRAAFDLIETRAGQLDPDGALSRADLEWATAHLHGDLAVAAGWLLAQPDFLGAVATADGDDDYLDDIYRPSFIAGDADWWADDTPLTIEALTAFEDHLAAWSTLIFSGTEIDVAAHGGGADGVLSKADFEAFLERRDLPAEIRTAAQQAYDDAAWHDAGGLDFIPILELASFIPVVGDAIDAGMMLYYLSEGDMAGAFAHGLGLVPIPGVSGGAVRGARELVTEVASRYTDEGLAAAGGIIARQTTQSIVTTSIVDEAEDAASEYTDNPYLLSTFDVVLAARLGQAADRHWAALPDIDQVTAE